MTTCSQRSGTLESINPQIRWREHTVYEPLVSCNAASVWLECSAELIDIGSVDVLRIREAGRAIELVEFVCPRCGKRHTSLRFA